MSQKDMRIVLGGVTIAPPSSFKRLYRPNEAEVETLGGTLYTDFINNRRGWLLTWKLIREEDFEVIHEMFLQQYVDGSYPMLQYDAYGIYVPVKIAMNDQDIRYNGALIANLQVTLKEQYAFS